MASSSFDTVPSWGRSFCRDMHEHGALIHGGSPGFNLPHVLVCPAGSAGTAPPGDEGPQMEGRSGLL